MMTLNRIQRIAIPAAALVFAATILCGCKSSKKTNQAPPTAVQASPERMAEIRANYAAIPGYVVGDVEAVDAQNSQAALAGIDPNLVNKQSIFSFVDASSGSTTNNGFMVEQTPAGRILVNYDPNRPAPKQGDFVAVKSASK